jgi:hypothetical protein
MMKDSFRAVKQFTNLRFDAQFGFLQVLLVQESAPTVEEGRSMSIDQSKAAEDITVAMGPTLTKVLYRPHQLRSSHLPDLFESYRESVHLAIIRNDYVMLWYILQDDNEARAMTNSKGDSAVHMAAKFGSLDCLKVLLDAQSNDFLHKLLSAVNSSGYTPLYLAAQNGHVKVVKFIVSLLPDAATIAAGKGALPIHIAAQQHHLEVVKILCNLFPSTLLTPRMDGNIPLHMAFRGNNITTEPPDLALILLLCASRSDIVEYKNCAGKTPVETALRCNASPEVMRAMLLLSPDSFPRLLEDTNWVLRRSAVLASFAETNNCVCTINATKDGMNTSGGKRQLRSVSLNILFRLRQYDRDLWKRCICFL